MTKEHDRRSIESQGRRWADRRMERITQGLDRSVKIVRETRKYEEIDDLPSFIDRGVSRLKYDEAGNIYVSKWHSKKTQLDKEDKRHLYNPSGHKYCILDPQHPRKDYLDNLPLDIPVVELIWAKVDGGIESAIRKQEHILGAYDPVKKDGEIKVAQRVIEFVDKLSTKFIKEKVGKGNLEELAEKTETFLEENDLISPKDRDKKHIRDMLLAVSNLDSLGRVNPLVSRVRARAAYLAATRRLVLGSLVAEKYGSNLEVLSYEREITRWALRTVVKQMDYYVLSHSFIKRGFGGTELQITSLKDVIHTLVDGHLSTPRVKPYLPIARYAQISLVGADMGKGEMTKDTKIFGEELTLNFYKQIPVVQLLDFQKYWEVRSRVERITKSIRKVLDDYKNIEK